MKKIVLVLIVFFTSLISFSQEGEVIDGIKKKLKSHKQKDSVKVELILDLAWEYSYFDLRKSISYCNEALEISKSINYDSGLAGAYSIKGNCYRVLTMYDSAYHFLNEALVIRKKQKRKNKIAAVLQNIANIYYQEGKITEAISRYKEAIELSKEAGDQKAMVVAITNLSSVYRQAGLTKKALESFNLAFEINKVLKDQEQESYLYANMATLQSDLGNHAEAVKYGLMAMEAAKKRNDIQQQATVANNLGMFYRASGDLKQSSQYYQESMKLYETIGDSLSLALISNNMANLFIANKQYDLAIFSSLKALRIAKKENATELTYNSLMSLATAYKEKKEFSKALAYVNEARPLVEKNAVKNDIRDMYSDYSDIYYAMKDYKNASDNMLKLMAYTDTLHSENNAQLATTLGMEMELNSKENQIELLEKNAEIKEIELKRQKTMRWFFIGVSSLFALIGLIILFSYRKIKKANVIINEQKHNLEIKNVEISSQKELIEVKQKEIIDSINYAKRIQTAVLSGKEIWNKIAKDHFILFKPKDIVSGDFYWAYNTPNGRSIFALADCTGHGVPGGFMSMLGNSFLNEIVVEDKVFKADAILNKLRDKIIGALDQEGNSQQKDGMDMALCVWNKMDNTLEYAGANNPLWMLRKMAGSGDFNGYEMHEFKPDKMPIGSHTEDLLPFTSQVIQLQKGDIIYLITDGFADQFGGPKGKKFKYKPLKELLLVNHANSMEEQKRIFELAINEWQHGYEQVDDITLIGVRV